jgi:hypothetical protein
MSQTYPIITVPKFVWDVKTLKVNIPSPPERPSEPTVFEASPLKQDSEAENVSLVVLIVLAGLTILYIFDMTDGKHGLGFTKITIPIGLIWWYILQKMAETRNSENIKIIESNKKRKLRKIRKRKSPTTASFLSA